jgi:hypothetical protein
MSDGVLHPEITDENFSHEAPYIECSTICSNRSRLRRFHPSLVFRQDGLDTQDARVDGFN